MEFVDHQAAAAAAAARARVTMAGVVHRVLVLRSALLQSPVVYNPKITACPPPAGAVLYTYCHTPKVKWGAEEVQSQCME